MGGAHETADTMTTRIEAAAIEMDEYADLCGEAAHRLRFARRAQDRVHLTRWRERAAAFALAASTMRAILTDLARPTTGDTDDRT